MASRILKLPKSITPLRSDHAPPREFYIAIYFHEYLCRSLLSKCGSSAPGERRLCRLWTGLSRESRTETEQAKSRVLFDGGDAPSHCHHEREEAETGPNPPAVFLPCACLFPSFHKTLCFPVFINNMGSHCHIGLHSSKRRTHLLSLSINSESFSFYSLVFCR